MFTKLSFFFGGPRLLSDKINSACNYDLKKKKEKRERKRFVVFTTGYIQFFFVAVFHF